jgi:hypothetical protein
VIKIRVSGGFARVLRLRISDAQLEDLSSADFRVAMVASTADSPARTDTSWTVPESVTFPKAGQAVITFVVDESSAPVGQYYPHVLIIDSPEVVPILVGDDLIQTT